MRDPYVAEMKAVILNICPTATIIDITHQVDPFNVRMGAYVLATAANYFPRDTIHVAVVDPGVGTERRPLLLQTQQSFFVGPDNGLLLLAAEQQGVVCIREITNTRLMNSNVSNTFHGRDVFAPAAAHLANGVSPTDFGSETHRAVKPSFVNVTLRDGNLIGEILHIDNFGNVITNITAEHMMQIGTTDALHIELAHQKLKLKFCKTYAEAKLHQPLALIGSQGYFEIAVNKGSAARKFNLKPGDKIKISATPPRTQPT